MTRESRYWWYVTEDYNVVLVKGLSCAPEYPTHWYLAGSYGVSVKEGVLIFSDRKAALECAIAKIDKKLQLLTGQKARLESEREEL